MLMGYNLRRLSEPRGFRCGSWLCCLGRLRDRAARYCVELTPLRYCSRCVDCGSQHVPVLRFAVEKVKDLERPWKDFESE